MKKLLIIAGSSSDGGAGVQIDIKTAHVIGAYATTVITCLTAQNTMGVKKVEITSMFEEQLKAVLEDIEIDCIKFGVMPDQRQFDVFQKSCKDIPFVLDPVMVAEADNYGFVKEVKKLLSIGSLDNCVIMTPNLIEASKLTGIKINSISDAELAYIKLKEEGVANCIIKGVGVPDNPKLIADVLFYYSEKNHSNYKKKVFLKERKPYNYHGSGCCFATAIASYYMFTENILTSVLLAERFIDQAISRAVFIGQGHVKVVVP